MRFFSYWAALTSFVALFIIYRRFLKRMNAAPVVAAPQGFCGTCGTPHTGDAFCGGCGVALAAAPPAAPAAPGGGAQ